MVALVALKWVPPQKLQALRHTTLQSKMNAKLSPQRFWACHENGLIKAIQTIPHNLYVVGYRLKCLDEPIFMAGPKPMRTEFGICQRLESCVIDFQCFNYFNYFPQCFIISINFPFYF